MKFTRTCVHLLWCQTSFELLINTAIQMGERDKNLRFRQHSSTVGKSLCTELLGGVVYPAVLDGVAGVRAVPFVGA